MPAVYPPDPKGILASGRKLSRSDTPGCPLVAYMLGPERNRLSNTMLGVPSVEAQPIRGFADSVPVFLLLALGGFFSGAALPDNSCGFLVGDFDS